MLRFWRNREANKHFDGAQKLLTIAVALLASIVDDRQSGARSLRRGHFDRSADSVAFPTFTAHDAEITAPPIGLRR